MRKYVTLLLLFVLAIPMGALAYATETLHWGMPAAKNEKQAYAGEKFHRLTQKYDAIYMENTKEKNIYLTFDNGYENGYTPKILDTLKEKNVSATFFLTGQFVCEHPQLVKRMVEEGHIIGNHMWSHPNPTTLDDQGFKEEVDKIKNAVAKITTQKEMKYLRPPEGVFNERTLALGKKLGYTQVFWSLAYLDWNTNNQKGAKYAYDSIMARLHPGAIILLHTISSDNAGALGKVIDHARKKGYQFKSLDQFAK